MEVKETLNAQDFLSLLTKSENPMNGLKNVCSHGLKYYRTLLAVKAESPETTLS
jgi:hypothetical protein